jgi:KaiC/GvpD/RAD55 family RecA-like ATPase
MLRTVRVNGMTVGFDSVLRDVRGVVGGQVVVVEGETGSGKTTQVPQFILDSYIQAGRGAECNIICTRESRPAVCTPKALSSTRPPITTVGMLTADVNLHPSTPP